MFEFTKRAKKILEVVAQAEAKRLNSDTLEPEHVLLALLGDEDSVAARILKNLGISFDQLKKEIEDKLTGNGNSIILGRLPIGQKYKKIIDLSKEEARKLKNSYIGTEHILLAIFREGDIGQYETLKQGNVEYAIVRNEILRVLGVKIVSDGKEQVKQTRKDKSIEEFSVDLTAMAMQGKLEPVIGRDMEISRMIRILSRKRKNNPILIGEAGVGKTAIVEGLAMRIVNREVPETLFDYRIYSLDMASVVAGTKYRGEFEERLKNLIKEITKRREVIIFIDEIHSIMGAGAAEGAIDAANILKPALARGDIQCVGATTMNEYKQHIEKDAALVRRFQSILVEEPDIDETIQILKGLRSSYEKHHRVMYDDDALVYAAKLSERFINDRFLPDKAIDLIDEAGSMARLENVSKPGEITTLEETIAQLNEEKNRLVLNQEYEKAAAIRDQIAREKTLLKDKLENWYNKTDEYTIMVNRSKISEVVAESTGIPVDNIQESENEKLLRMKELIHEHIIGQEEAVDAIVRAIKRSRVGLKRPNTPRGSFIFLGPTGVGKTELAKVLARFLFDSDQNLVRIDMSEYMERHAVSKLVGSPPGYVGYDEGGQLTERVRRRPYSVILFDEMEKAHPDVFNILLQVMEEGQLTDSSGVTVSFRDTIIIMTTNVGGSEYLRGGTLGFTEESLDDSREEKIDERVRQVFAPEFINRVDEVIHFKHLSKEDIGHILDIILVEINERLGERNISLDVTPGVRKELIDRGYDMKSGARNLRRVIQRELEDPLVEQILEGRFGDNSCIKATARGNSIQFKKVQPKEEENEVAQVAEHKI